MATLAKLTDLACKQAKPAEKVRRLTDGGGLYLLIDPKGSKYWRYDYRFHGRRQTLALGIYPEVSLIRARDLHTRARMLLADGVDPMQQRKVDKVRSALSANNTFQSVAEEYLAKKQLIWAPSHFEKVAARLRRDVFPWIGSLSMDNIKEPELLAVLNRIEGRGVIETAHRARENCGQVFRYAIQTGRASYDPTINLRGALVTAKAKHFAAITNPRDFAKLLRSMYGYQGELVTRCILRLSAMLFQRPKELRLAMWSEFDLDGKKWGAPMWEIPSEREDQLGDTKISLTGWESHLVPLSRQAVEILKILQPVTGSSGMVFQSPLKPRQPISNNTPMAAIKRLGFKGQMTVHGFRASARTMAVELLGIDQDLLELQISHKVSDSLGRAYNRTTWLKERVTLMQTWSDYLDTLATGNNVVPLLRAANG
ncbi:tyrosine-type recombinase/integrase [Alcaligenes nematophilus]